MTDRRPTSRSINSSYSHNFELLKHRFNEMRLNPEQQLSLTLKSHSSTPRYDRAPRSPAKKFRIHKQRNRNNQKTESGNTVFEILNIRNNNSNIDTSSRTSSNQQSSQVFSHLHQPGLLREQQIVRQPIVRQPKSYEINQGRKRNILFQERKWQLNQYARNVQCNVGTIYSQQFHRQSPLSPGKLQQFIKLAPILQQPPNKSTKQIQKILEQQDDVGLSSNHDTPMKNTHNYKLSVQKQLVKKLNSQTRYMRFRHNQKLKKSLKSNQSIFVSKQPSSNKVDKFVMKYGDPVQTILRILHHNTEKGDGSGRPQRRSNMNKNKIRISIQVPQFFHLPPDPFLSQEELKFKGINYFENLGIIPSEVSEHSDIEIIKKHDCFILQFDTNSLPNQYQSQKRKIYSLAWYLDDSVYLGEVLDDARQGMGMEWVPGVYVYYGQYKNNFKHGYGVIKYNNMKTYVGTWAYDHYHGYGKIISGDGEVLEMGTFRNSQLRSSEIFHELS